MAGQDYISSSNFTEHSGSKQTLELLNKYCSKKACFRDRELGSDIAAKFDKNEAMLKQEMCTDWPNCDSTFRITYNYFKLISDAYTSYNEAKGSKPKEITSHRGIAISGSEAVSFLDKNEKTFSKHKRLSEKYPDLEKHLQDKNKLLKFCIFIFAILFVVSIVFTLIPTKPVIATVESKDIFAQIGDWFYYDLFGNARPVNTPQKSLLQNLLPWVQMGSLLLCVIFAVYMNVIKYKKKKEQMLCNRYNELCKLSTIFDDAKKEMNEWEDA